MYRIGLSQGHFEDNMVLESILHLQSIFPYKDTQTEIFTRRIVYDSEQLKKT